MKNQQPWSRDDCTCNWNLINVMLYRYNEFILCVLTQFDPLSQHVMYPITLIEFHTDTCTTSSSLGQYSGTLHWSFAPQVSIA